MRTLNRNRRSRGFTLLELLIAVSVIAVLITLLLPSVQQARERARVVQCRNNLMQIGLALCHYDQVHGMLPSGCVNPTGPVTPDVPGYKLSWIVQILPCMGERGAAVGVDQIDPQWSWMGTEEREQLNTAIAEWNAAPASDNAGAAADAAGSVPAMSSDGISMGMSGTLVRPAPNDPITRAPQLSWLNCPSFPFASGQSGLSCYAGCQNSTEAPIDTDRDGLLYLNSSNSLEEIPDGRSQTVLVGEHLSDPAGQGWIYGDRSSLRNGGSLQRLRMNPSGRILRAVTNPGRPDQSEDQPGTAPLDTAVGTFGSYHTYQVHFALADGSVRPIRMNIAPAVLQQLISRYDGQVLSDHAF